MKTMPQVPYVLGGITGQSDDDDAKKREQTEQACPEYVQAQY
jgi:hypothetical protein